MKSIRALDIHVVQVGGYRLFLTANCLREERFLVISLGVG